MSAKQLSLQAEEAQSTEKINSLHDRSDNTTNVLSNQDEDKFNGSTKWRDAPFNIYSSESVKRCKPTLLMESSDRIENKGGINDNYIGVIPQHYYHHATNNGLFFVRPLKNQIVNISELLDNFYSLLERAKLQQSFVIVGGIFQTSDGGRNFKFYLEEVYWLSNWDAKLVPCPKFTRFNLENVNTTYEEELQFRPRDNEFMFFVIMEGDRKLNTVKLSRKMNKLLSQCFSFPIHTLYSNNPPSYDSLRERSQILGNQFNCLIEKEDWFKDNLHSHTILQKYLQPVEETENQSEAERNLSRLLQSGKDTWLNGVKDLQKYETFREYQDKKYAMTCVQKGVEFSKQKNYVKAHELYREALDYDEKNIDAYIGIGSAFYNQKSYPLASDNFQKASQIDPNHPIPKTYLEKTKGKIEQSLKERLENENKRKLEEEQQKSQPKEPKKSIHDELEQTLSKILHSNKKQRR